MTRYHVKTLITHHLGQALEISDLIQEFFVILVGLRLKEFNITLELGLLQFSEWCLHFLVELID